MKITIKKLQEMEPSLGKILKKDMPFKTAYRLKKIAGTMMAEMKIIRDTQNDIVKKHGDADKDNSNSYKVPPSKMKEYMKDWDAFNDTEIEIVLAKIPMDCLEKVEMNALDVATLDDLIEEEPVKKKKNGK